MRRPYKSFSPHCCILCKESGESIDYLFLHYPITSGLWHKLFTVANLDWVPPRSIEDMIIISFRSLGNSIRGKTLRHIACTLYRGLCGKKEMLGFLRISVEQKGCYGILFISTPLFALLVPSLLEEFPLMLFYLVGFRFVIRKG